jgi:hypothetical protein
MNKTDQKIFDTLDQDIKDKMINAPIDERFGLLKAKNNIWSKQMRNKNENRNLLSIKPVFLEINVDFCGKLNFHHTNKLFQF